MEKVVNLHMVNGKRPYYDIYIGRELNYPKATFPRSKWANPYSVKKYGRKKSLELYEKHIRNTPRLWNALDELKDKILGDWCKPEPCHGDILTKLLKEIKNRKPEFKKGVYRVYIKCPYCRREDRSYMDKNKIIECCSCRKTFHLMHGREENKNKIKSLKNYLENNR